MDNQTQPTQKKKSSPVTLLVFLVIVGVLIYVLAGGDKDKKKEDDQPKPSTVENQIELNEDNISHYWVREVDGKIYSVDFGPDDGFSYACRSKGETGLEFCSNSGSFVISGNTIEVNYTLDNVEYTEKYYVALSETELVIEQTEDGFTTIIGTYSKDWKRIYLNYIPTLPDFNNSYYALAYIDDDDVPELYIDSYGEAKVCTYYNGKITSIDLEKMYGEAGYIERSGLFKQTGYRSDISVDVYQLKEGVFSITHIGESDDYSYYTVDGKSVTSVEYEKTVNTWIDPIRLSSFNTMGYMDMAVQLSS